MQRLNVAPHECYTFFQLQHRHAHSLSHILERGTSSLFYTRTLGYSRLARTSRLSLAPFWHTHTLGYSRPRAHFETLTRRVPAQHHSFLVPAPQHRLHGLIGSLRQPSRAAVPLRLPLFLDSLCVLDAGFLASDSRCPLSRRFTTPTDHLHRLLSRLGLAPRLNSLHAQSHFPVVRTTAVLPSASACPRQAASLRNSQHISHALSRLGLALTRCSLVSPLQSASLPPLDFPLDLT